MRSFSTRVQPQSTGFYGTEEVLEGSRRYAQNKASWIAQRIARWLTDWDTYCVGQVENDLVFYQGAFTGWDFVICLYTLRSV